jgi:hypothetical protein
MPLHLLSTHAKAYVPTTQGSTSNTSTGNTGGTSFNSLLNSTTSPGKEIQRLQKLGYGTLHKATTQVGLNINLKGSQEAVATNTYDVNNPKKNMSGGTVKPHYTKNVSVVDAQGKAHVVQMGFVKISATQWAVEVIATDSKYTSNGRIARGTLEFDSGGSLVSVSASLTKPTHVQWASGGKESVISFNFGKPGEYEGMTGFATDYTTTSLTQDGATPGKLEKQEIARDKKSARLFYDNGLIKDVKLPPNYTRL